MPVFRTLLALLACASFALADHELRTIGGKTIKGNVVAITPTEVVQQGESGPVKTPLAQVLAIDLQPLGKPASDIPHSLVRLVDDSLLRCSQVELKGKEVEIKLLSGQAAKVPLGAVTWILKEAQDAKVRHKWDELVSAKVKRDRIVVLRAGELNPLEGTIGEVDAQGKTIGFRRESGDQTAAVPLERLTGLIFYRTEAPAEAPVCVVYDTDGDVLPAAKVAVAGGSFRITTPAGFSVNLGDNVLARLDYNRGKLTFLSDLEPAKVVSRFAFGLGALNVCVKKDKNLNDGPILLAGTTYAKGLSLHAYVELEYDLGGKYKDFKALLGVDPSWLEGSSAVSQAIVTIECDGDKRFAQAVDAKTVRPVSVNVRDVRRLRIIVSSPNADADFNTSDHATLAEARVSQ